MIAGALRLVQLCSCGLLAGAWCADWMALAPVRRAMTPSTLIIVQQGLQSHFRGVLPWLILVALISGAGALCLLRRERREARYALLALGTLSLVGAMIVARLGNAPIDSELMNWTANAPPENLRDLWQPWEHWHALRTMMIGVSFALLCFSAMLPRGLVLRSVLGVVR